MPQLQSIKTLLNQVRDAQQQTSNQVPGQHPEMVVSTQGPEGEQQYSEVVAQYNPRLKTSVAPQFQQYEDAKYKYLDADISDVDIPDPPKDDSHTTRMELEEIEEVIQEAKLPSKLLRVSNEDPLRLFYSVAKKKGLDPHEAEAKAWADDWTKFSFELKDKYQRRRPWEVKKEHDIDFVHHKLDSTESPSYPSGHAMLAYGVAEFYKGKYPLMEEQWDDIAELISHSRVQMGVHYPSDIKASKQVVAQVSGKIKTGSERLRTTIFGVDPEGKLLHGFGDKGFYKFPGGGVDAGESITDAAKRELLEEAGYRVNSIEELAGLDTADSVGASSAKGHMGHGSSRTKYLLARLGDRDSSLLGSEGDAISGLQTAGIDEVIQGLEGDMLFGSGVAGSNHAALTRLKAILQKTAAPKHLELRRQQRAKYLDPENLKTIEDKVQSASDLPEGANYITLPHGRKAVVRTEGGKSHLATILGPAMRPPGRDVSSMVKEATGFNKQLFIKEAVALARKVIARKVLARRSPRHYPNYANRSKVPKAPRTPKRTITRQQFNKANIKPPVKAAPSPTTPTPATTSPTSGGRMQGIGNFVNQHPGAAVFGGVTAVGGTTLGVNKYKQHKALQQAPAFRKASSYKQANDLSVLNKLGAIDLLTGQMGAGKSTLLDKIRDQYDIVEGTDLGGVVDGKFIEPSAEDKPRLRQEKADRLLAAHNEGKRVLMEGYPPGLFRIPGMVEAADRAVVLQPDTLQRLMQIGNRSKERGTSVEEDIRYAISPEHLAKENKYLDMLRKAIGTTHIAPTSEDAEAYLLGKQANDLNVLTAVPTQNLDLIMRKGLYSQKAMLEDPEVMAAFLAQRNADKAWKNDEQYDEKRFREQYDKRRELATKPEALEGPSVFYTEPDPDKVSDPRHFINQFDTQKLRVNLAKLLQDIPETRVHGAELEPFNEAAHEADPENYWMRRHRDLTPEEVAKYIATDPKELWKNYKDEYIGRYYAADVPHGHVITPSGIIPPEYLEQVEKTSEEIPELNKWIKSIEEEARNRGVTDMHVVMADPKHPLRGGGAHYTTDLDKGGDSALLVQALRKKMKDWELERGLDPDHDWHKTSSAKDDLKHILVTGHSGAGKSTYAKELAEELGMPRHRLDVPAGPIMEAEYPGYWDDGTMGYPKDVSTRIIQEALGLETPHVIEGSHMLEVPELTEGYKRILVDTPEDRVIEQRAQREYRNRERKGKPYRPIEEHRGSAKELVDFYRDLVSNYRDQPGVESIVPEVKTAQDKLKHILITGQSGSGKTTEAKRLAEELGMPAIHLDQQKGFGAKGKDPDYIDDVTEATQDILKNLKEPHIVEGTQLLSEQFPVDLLKQHDLRVLEADEDELIKRLTERGWETESGRELKGPGSADEAKHVVNHQRKYVDKLLSKLGEARTLYHGSPLDLEELIPQQARGSRQSTGEHKQKAVYLAKDPKEALLYALMSRPDGLGNYGVADGTAYYPEGRPLNERGYVYKVDVDDYQEPEDPRAGVAIKEPLIPSSKEEVLLKDHLDKLVSLPNHEAYRAKIRDILTKTSEAQPLLRHRSTLLIRDPETNKLLAANNREDRNFDDVSPYYFPGGGLYDDEYDTPRTPTEEEILEGARREALEELGMTLKNPRVIGGSANMISQQEWRDKALRRRGVPYEGGHEHLVLADKGDVDNSLYNVEGDAFTKGKYFDPQEVYDSLTEYGSSDGQFASYNREQARAIKEHLLSKQVAS